MSAADHLLTLGLLVVVPLYSRWSFHRLMRAIESGDLEARVREYRSSVVHHLVIGSLPILLWIVAERPWPALGLSVPSGSGFLVAGAVAGLGVVFFAWQARMVATHPEAREQVRGQLGRIEYLLPHSPREMSHFAYVSLTAGIFEELLYRGFLLWYAAQLMPMWAAVLATSAAFGAAHFYQGVAGVGKTGVAGLVLAVLYVLSGSLWVPMILHWLADHLQGRMLNRVLQPA